MTATRPLAGGALPVRLGDALATLGDVATSHDSEWLRREKVLRLPQPATCTDLQGACPRSQAHGVPIVESCQEHALLGLSFQRDHGDLVTTQTRFVPLERVLARLCHPGVSPPDVASRPISDVARHHLLHMFRHNHVPCRSEPLSERLSRVCRTRQTSISALPGVAVSANELLKPVPCRDRLPIAESKPPATRRRSAARGRAPPRRSQARWRQPGRRVIAIHHTGARPSTLSYSPDAGHGR